MEFDKIKCESSINYQLLVNIIIHINISISNDYVVRWLGQSTQAITHGSLHAQECVLLRRFVCPYVAKTVNLPFLADSINEGTVAKLLKSYSFFIGRGRRLGRPGRDCCKY